MNETTSSLGKAFDRRHLLRRAGQGGLAVALGALGVSACSSDNATGGGPTDTSSAAGGSTTSPPTSTGAGSSAPPASTTGAKGAPAPAHIPFSGVTPDIPSGAHGIPAGFYRYPDKPSSFVSTTPGRGGDVSFMLEGGAVKTQESQNQWWKYLNDKLGIDIKLHITSNADYLPKFQTSVAGGLQDDFVQFIPVANTPQLLEQEFAELTDHLSGDNIKKYPGLASIPTPTWQIGTINGRIWGIAQPRPATGNIPAVRGDVLQSLGISRSDLSLADGKAFMDFCAEVTDVKAGRYAMGEEPNIYILPAMLEMMGAPNGWSEASGKFTSVNETDQMKDALDQLAKMWSAHYINPDSFINPNHGPWWSGGKILVYFATIAVWPNYANLNPEWNVGALTLPKWDGGGPADKLLGVAGYSDFVGIKKASADRVEELLQICDYLAAPFGTQEFLDVNYGVQGKTYNLEDGKIVTLPAYSNYLFSALRYVGSQVYADVYVPGQKDVVDEIHKYLSDVLPTGVSNPTWGLYSETAVTKGAAADKAILDAQADVIQGRKKVSEWDGIVATWRKQAGDEMRDDYEAAFAASQ